MSLKDFQVISKLGEGAYSSVYKVKRVSDGQDYALKKVKIMNLSDKEKQNALNEVRILASIRHPNIVQYKEAFIDENSSSLCIIMEYLDSGDLYQKIVELQKQGTLMKENDIWNIFIQMVQGLRALHDLKIFHRDMKSANIFLGKDGIAKLGDLNVSKVAKKGLLYTQTGTPYYASPEVWRDQPYDQKSDIWSLGCVLYEMTTLKPPFRAEDMEGLYKKVLRGYFPRIPSHFSQDLSNVIRALLQVAPQLRPTSDRILQLPSIVKRMEEKHFLEADENQNILLMTIRLPKNIHFLTDRLPKANYAPLRTRPVDKTRFLATLAGYKNVVNENRLQPYEDRLMKGSESVDTHKKDKLPGLKDNSDEIFRVYGGAKEKEKKLLPIHKTNLNDLNDKSFSQNEDPLVQKIAEEQRRGREREGYQPRRGQNQMQSEQPGRNNLRDINKDSISMEPPSKRLGYAVHNLNSDVIFDELSGGYSHKEINKAAPQKSVKKLDGYDIKYENSPYVSKKKNPDNVLNPYRPDKVPAGRLPSISPDVSRKVGRLPSISKNPGIYNYEASPYKIKPKEITRPYKANLGNIDELQDRYNHLEKDTPPKKDLLKENYMVKNQSTAANKAYIDGLKYHT